MFGKSLSIVYWLGNSLVLNITNKCSQGFLIDKGREIIKELKALSVNKISVGLNAQDKETHNQVCKSAFNNAFESILEFIEKAKVAFDIEVTAVAIPEIDASRIEDVTRKMGAKFRVREYMPCYW